MDSAVLKRARGSLEQLRDALPERGRVLIIPHDHPDPDALASAAAVELLLSRHFKLRGRIVFTGTVSRAENREMLRIFRYKWRLLSQVKAPPEPLPCIFVDTAPWSGNVTVPEFGRPVAVFDHHPLRKPGQSRGLFTDIREGRGATAAVLTEYLVAADIGIPQWLATVLVYAIATETLDLSRGCTNRDLDAYKHLLDSAHFGVLGRIRHAPLTRAYFTHMREAMDNARTYGRVAWTHLGDLKEPEIVAELADLLLRMERITWAFCTAFIDDRLIISLRSNQDSARCGRLLRKLLEAGGTGGGHHYMAAGYIDVAGLTPAEREVQRERVVQGLLREIEPRSERSQQEPTPIAGNSLA